MEMELELYFTLSVANLAFGRSLWIEVMVRPMDGQVHFPEGIIVPAAVSFLDVSFTLGASVVQIRVESHPVNHPPDAWYRRALVWVIAIGVGLAAVSGTLVAMSSHINRRMDRLRLLFGSPGDFQVKPLIIDLLSSLLLLLLIADEGMVL